MKKDYIEQLQKLRQKLQDKSLSVLVGAGFSKNVHPTLFPSWWQLLEKMVLRMNNTLYSCAFMEKTKKDPESAKEDYSRFCSEQVNQYIEQTGYLNVVSNYIRKMGFRETVDVYIEENTPLAVRIEGKPFLKIKENGQFSETAISESDLELHSQLIRLPWSNIYTTNYDNLLEFCIDIETADGLKLQLKKLDEEIQDLLNEIPALEIEFKDLEEKLNAQELGRSSQYDVDIELRKSRNSTGHHLELKKVRQKSLIEKKSTIEAALNECYNIVKHSSDLALKRNRNIIKLHGSLPESENELFEFDNEFNKRYIISNEDYEGYPQHHEAFTQLMRISLLQGNFCLIGFSGDDPNFLAWVSWIRTVVTRKNSRDNDDIKIYLIDARATKAPDAHKEQFYKNHSIAYIPLSSPVCIEFLESASGKPINANNVKSILKSFIDYLSDIPVIDIPKVSYELLGREQYESYMDLFENRAAHSSFEDVLKVCENYHELEYLKRFSRIPAFHNSNNFSKIDFLLRIGDYFKSAIKEKKEFQTNFLKLVCLVLNDLFLPYSCVISNEEFALLKSKAKAISPELYYHFLKQEIKDAIWRCDGQTVKKIHQVCSRLTLEIYERDKPFLLALNDVTSMRFSSLKTIADTIQQEDENVIALTAYWSIVDREKALKFIRSQKFDLVQEELYALEIERVLRGFDNDKRLYERLEQLKFHGLRRLADNQDYVLSQKNKRTHKVDTYSADDYIDGLILGGDSEKEALCIQMLGMMLETGLPFSRDGGYLRHRDDIYPILKTVLKRFPMPVLYFALQYNDSKFIKRIGQDYAFTDDLGTSNLVIFESLAKSYFDDYTPWYYKSNILIFLSQFIISLPPSTWEQFFLSVWNEKKQNGALFIRDREDDFTFIESSIRFIQDRGIIKLVLYDCLEQAKDFSHIEGCTQCLFLLNKNAAYTVLKIKKTEKKISNYINYFIQLIEKQPHCLRLLGNINEHLTVEQKKTIQASLGKLTFSKLNNSNLWMLVAFYGKGNKPLYKKLVHELIKSPMLWQTGISTDEKGRRILTLGLDFISLRRLMKGGSEDINQAFTRKKILTIYHKLKVSVEQMKLLPIDRINGFNSLLREMRWFLDAENNVLRSDPNFKDIVDTVETLSGITPEPDDLVPLIMSSSLSDINNSISTLSREFYDNGNFDKYTAILNLAVNKVLLKHGPGIILLLEYLNIWCRDFGTKSIFRNLAGSILQILNSYRLSYPPDLYIPKLEVHLICLASTLKKWDYESESISHFLSLLKSSRFNNIRYNLKAKLSS
ncbi:SIR2 family protein [Taibaiella chishuiensis]|uniref:SIR2-like protein n=1 Tax=Taibaiella chishuiensis TaxID=1434707 RepID=A0A2P8CVJ9_9BACT|nr:SIR2 family protein [Taibaiella chishuiensis]PSK89001.1 SIR2-like protein [Taibaiella chishuiensis]